MKPFDLPAVTVDKSTALVRVSVSHDLAVVSKSVHDDGQAFERITRGRGDYVSRTGLQKAAACVRGWDLVNGEGVLLVGLTSALSGLVIGGVSALWGGVPAFEIIGGSVAALGVTSLPASWAILTAAKSSKSKAAEKLVPLKDVQDLIARLEKSHGVERALVLATATEWFSSLSGNHALSPEARVALDAAIKAAGKASPQDHADVHKRVTTLKDLVEALKDTNDVDPSYLNRLEAIVMRIPEEERPELMRDVAKQLDTQKQTYAGKHALYDLKLKYGIA